MPEPAIPQPAATVVVIRPFSAPGHGPFEVLLLRRSASMSFMAGAHVFPGGRVDEADRGFAADLVTREPAQLPRFPHLDVAGEVACRVASVRELVEEAGVLLARQHDGRWATTEEAELVRARLTTGAGFADVIRDGGWCLDLDAVVPFAEVLTPASEPRRFDAHFFLALLPAGQRASPDEVESDELVWLTPARALASGSSGTVSLMPPTWATLMQLASFGSVADLLAWGRERSIERVEPRLTSAGAGRLLVVPAASVPPSGPGSLPSDELRFSFEVGRGWRPVA